MKILCCSDIHMGRIPSVPYMENLLSHSSWDAVVSKALELKADVLTLSGDVVEQEEHWFEAYGPLLSGLKKLGEAGVQVIGVGGNHDYSAFPSLAKESPHIKILGLGGEWEHFDHKGVRFVGWSFAERRVQQNPLDSFDHALTETELPLLGLLHCDVGAPPSSRYAPVALHDFSRTSVPLWVLGHIHKAEVLKGGNAFYCGSPYALDSNEEGMHGLWLLEKEEDKTWDEPKLVPLCPYRFESCTVSLDGVQSEDEARTALSRSLREFASEIPFGGTLLCSLILEGTIARTLDVRNIFTQEKLEVLWTQIGDWEVRPLARLKDNTVFDVDLQELSEGTSAIALLARKLLEESELKKMAAQYKSLDMESLHSPAFQHVDQSSIIKSEEEYIRLATQAAKRLLFAMINSEQGGLR